MQALLSLVGETLCIQISINNVILRRIIKRILEGRVKTGRPIGEACGSGMTGVQQRLPMPMVR